MGYPLNFVPDDADMLLFRAMLDTGEKRIKTRCCSTDMKTLEVMAQFGLVVIDDADFSQISPAWPRRYWLTKLGLAQAKQRWAMLPEKNKQELQ